MTYPLNYFSGYKKNNIVAAPEGRRQRGGRGAGGVFKKPVNTVNNSADDVVNIPESSCTVVNSDVNSEDVSSASNCCSLPEKPYHSSNDFVFLETKFRSRNPRSCQHNWFDNYPWLH